MSQIPLTILWYSDLDGHEHCEPCPPFQFWCLNEVTSFIASGLISMLPSRRKVLWQLLLPSALVDSHHWLLVTPMPSFQLIHEPESPMSPESSCGREKNLNGLLASQEYYFSEPLISSLQLAITIWEFQFCSAWIIAFSMLLGAIPTSFPGVYGRLLSPMSQENTPSQ